MDYQASRRVFSVVIGAILYLLSTPGISLGDQIDFETVVDSEIVTTQFLSSGVQFSNTIALAAGISLNELEFPPHSGDIVGTNEDGGMAVIIDFLTPVKAVGGFFTYDNNSFLGGSDMQITFSAFDENGSLVDTAFSTSPFFSNRDATMTAFPDDCDFITNCMPNEFLEVSGGASIVRVEINPNGALFTLDDLTFTPVPEPSTVWLMATGLGLLLGWSWRQKCCLCRSVEP